MSSLTNISPFSLEDSKAWNDLMPHKRTYLLTWINSNISAEQFTNNFVSLYIKDQHDDHETNSYYKFANYLVENKFPFIDLLMNELVDFYLGKNNTYYHYALSFFTQFISDKNYCISQENFEKIYPQWVHSTVKEEINVFVNGIIGLAEHTENSGNNIHTVIDSLHSIVSQRKSDEPLSYYAQYAIFNYLNKYKQTEYLTLFCPDLCVSHEFTTSNLYQKIITLNLNQLAFNHDIDPQDDSFMVSLCKKMFSLTVGSTFGELFNISVSDYDHSFSLNDYSKLNITFIHNNNETLDLMEEFFRCSIKLIL